MTDFELEALRAVLSYDQNTGLFTWTKVTARRIKVGQVAGRLSGQGYWRIHYRGRSYPAHHVAWAFVHGAWPPNFIDHINLLRSDNRIANLREATAQQNRQNTRLPSNNTSGFKGVSRLGKKWRAEIMADNRPQYLGLHDTPLAASEAYLQAKRALHSHYVEEQGVRRG